VERLPGSSTVTTFEEVYDRFRTPVWRLARRLMDTEDEALDATQEIFLRVWRGLAGFRGESKLSTWVFQIAWNYLRGARRRQARMPVRQEAREGDDPLTRLREPGADPERRATAVEAVARLKTALAALPEHQRAVIWLRDGEDLTYEEIASVLDVPIGTVRSRLARARSALRKAVEER
jgi:RNA polymerase sigma-70 factor (ECF subfamily)